MVEATQAADQIEKQMDRTDFGHFVYTYRKLLLAIFVAIVLGATGYLLWKQAKDSSALKKADEVYAFASTSWAEAKTGKLAPDLLVKNFDALPEDIRQAPAMVPVVLEMGSFLAEKGLYSEANEILKNSNGLTELGNYFVGMQRVVILEKLGQNDEAITVLEGLNGQKNLPLPQKVSLELGRFYMMKGDKGKAQTQFQDVISSYPNDEYAKIAKLYLIQLGK
jgi:predicted negative regulator of RcsB-dependent stress response